MLGVRCDVDIFKLTARAQSINREVYDITFDDLKKWVKISQLTKFGDFTKYAAQLRISNILSY